MKRLISTDTSAVINYDVFKKNELSVFALNVIVDGQEYLDSVTIDQDTLCSAMRANKSIKTSTPPLGEVISYFEELFNKGYDEIIHFTISSKLSSMNDLFNNVAKNNFPGKLFIVDSYGLSSPMLSQVILASEEMKKGTPTKEILELVSQRTNDYKAVFIPENLTSLKNGGRISPTIAIIGNVLGIKPVLSMKDGALDKEGTTKQVRKTMIESTKEMFEKFPLSDYDYTLINFDAKPDLIEYIKTKIEEDIGQDVLITGLIPINVCAHCGPGTVAILASRKINGKSLKEFL
ncbi:MAG: DegV family EDD domain-containing protein [Clostridiales bacterium]|nr:DegV family EDD domain-containing protein [Clostridiales bacterium]